MSFGAQGQRPELAQTFWGLLVQRRAHSMGSESGAGVGHFFWLPWQSHSFTEIHPRASADR